MRDDIAVGVEAASLGELLARAVERLPDREAIVFPGERLTFADLDARARALARGLIGLGVESGERVGILMPNSPDCVASMFGVAKAGAVFVPINTRYRGSELPHVVTDAGLKVILTSDRMDDYTDLVGLLADSLPGLAGAAAPRELLISAAPALRAVVSLGETIRSGTVSEAELLEIAGGVADRDVRARGESVRLRGDALILYTSGTTASPSGCRLTHEAIVRNWTAVGGILDLREGDRLWAPCPMFHLAAIGPLVMTVAKGATILSDTFYEPEGALRLIEQEQATHLYPAYPPITQALLDQSEFDSADLGAARVMLNVGPPDTLRQMQAAVPTVIQVTLYGSTEAGGAVTYSALDDDLDARTETCGLPLPGVEIRVVDPESRKEVASGERGEIAFRSVTAFDAYLNDPVKTDQSIDERGWFYSGDLGSLDEFGRLRFHGRLKEMLKVGGENVAPAEIESVLMSHPAVKLAQAVGVPDSRLEEVPVAFVELRSGKDASADELVDFCRERIASFKVPRHMRIVADWPMSATKVQKGVLRDEIIAELGLGDPGVS